MPSAPVPKNELARLRKLNLYRILDTPSEEAFDRITRLVADFIDVPIALVSLVDSERQWFKSKQGLDASETPREIAFCAHAILGNDLFVVEDASKDLRFLDNPLVADDPSIRFYAGAPLTTPDGLNLGTLCAIDRTPRTLTEKQARLLTDLASVVVDELELRIALRSAMNDVADNVSRSALKNEFISMVSHELRTPLTPIKGALGLLTHKTFSEIPEQASELVALALRNADNLLTLVNDLLDFKKIEAGKLEINFDITNCGIILNEVCENMHALAESSGINLELSSNVDEPLVADAGRLSQVLINIISNSIKFSPENGTVFASASANNRYITYRIKDSGPGIPISLRDSIFEMFTQAAGENKRKGTGLGLAISKSIVDAHGGKIWFDTELEKGSTFYVQIPLRQTILIE
jgi:two-component system, sensor histidine kinase